MKSVVLCMAVLAAALPAGAHDALVTTDWVYSHLEDPKVRLVEVSVDPGVYEQGHVQGAIGWKWHSQLCDTVGRDICTEAAFDKLCRESGISKDTTVVLYGDNNNWFACWAVWTFALYGRRDVKLMDGGRKKWELEKRPYDTTVPQYPPGDFTAQPADVSLRARLADVLEVVQGKKAASLIDVRSPDEYAGKIFAPPGIQELAIRAGHIPGARSVPWSKAVNDDGTFRSVEELKRLYSDAGVDASRPVITYCRIGERSSHTWFVLKVLLGYDARNYDGSWTEYGNAVGVPIENPTGTVWTGK